MSLTLYVLFEFTINVRKNLYKKALANIGFYLVFILVYLLSSSYWAINLISFIWFAGYTNSSVGQEVYAVDSLLNWTSSITSFTNIFRLYGDVVWFDGWADVKYFPEFSIYLQNPLLIISSFAMPFLVFYSLLVAKKRHSKHIAFFSLLTILGLFFSKGIHSPFGGTFAWMIDNVPLFWIHRAPWQKFSFITVVGYSVLGGFGVGYFYSYLVKRFKHKNHALVSLGLFVLVTSFFLVYNRLFVLGQMFPSKDSDVGYHGKFDLGFHHKFPDYLLEAKEYVNSINEEFKILLLPNASTTVYNWGYAGATDIVNLLFNKGTVSAQYGEGFAPPQSIEALLAAVFEATYTGSNTTISKTLGFMNIKYILQRNDFNYGFYGGRDSPEFIKSVLFLQNGIEKAHSFGEWDFYSIKDEVLYPIIYSPDSLVDYYGDSSGLVPVLERYDSQTRPGFYTNRPDSHQTIVYYSNLEEANDARPSFEDNDNWAWPNASISPTKFIYLVVRLKESSQLFGLSNSFDKVDVLTWLSSKRTAEIVSFPDIPPEQQKHLVSDIYYKRSEAFDLLKNVSVQEYDDNFTGMLYKFISYGDENIRRLMLTDAIDGDYISLLQSQQEEVLNWYTPTFTTDCIHEYCFIETVPASGEYGVSLLGESSTDLTTFLPLTLTIDGEEAYIYNSFQASHVVQLAGGEHMFELSSPHKPKNLITVQPLLSLPVNSDLSSLNQYVELIQRAKATPDASYIEVQDVAGLADYTFSFEYDLGTGPLTVLLVEYLDNNGTKVLINETLESNPDTTCSSQTLNGACVRSFSKSFRSSVGTSSFAVYFLDFSLEGADAQFTVTSLNLHQKFKPKILLTKEAADSGKVSPKHTVSYTRVNPTLYEITLNNLTTAPVDLIFNQNYHDGWRLYYEGTEISSESHQVANTWANGWTIYPAELNSAATAKIKLEFFPQRLFKWGVVISFSTLILLFVLNLGQYVSKSTKKSK